MLVDSFIQTTTVLAAATPGTVVAPAWFLPTAAAVTGLIPVSLLAAVKGMEKDKQTWELEAPEVNEGYAACHPTCFFVDDAGSKGRGLFSTQHVKKGTYLFDYSGDVLTKAEYGRRYPSQVSDYCAALRNPSSGVMHFVDGIDQKKGSPGRWMNHCDDKPNVGRRSFFPADGSNPRILMYAIRDLNPGDEMSWDYGKGFWDAHGGKVD